MESTPYDIAQHLRSHVAVLERRATELHLAVAHAEAAERGRGLARHLAGMTAIPCVFPVSVEKMADMLRLGDWIDSPAAVAWLAGEAHAAATDEWRRLGLAPVR